MVIVTGGGTGGHLYPGLAVARALRDCGQAVAYVGAYGGLEERVLPSSGLPYRLIPAGKLSRDALRPAEGFRVLRGLGAARQVLRQLRPRAVLSMGGYAGFPLAWMAALEGVPLVIHEQNARLGLANRVLAQLARRVALATPLALPPHLAAKSQVVGYPVREERYSPEEARLRLGLDPHRPTLLVLGGSQGSLELNRELPERLYPLLSHWQVLHQCGLRWEAEMKPREKPHYHIRGYVEGPLAWSAADLAITRGGAGTLAEAAYHRVPVLGVPLPRHLDGGAQWANVGFYAERGAARRLASWGDFERELNALLEPSTREQIRARLEGLSPAGAARRLVQVLLEVM
ncbi:UDP-N-acetylglucosamine--N-acetylmuramyl-(pentapeptide) pyrophosphoryl-undecaprenol N-acetylglucosamine transferase [Meiothermus sp. QL-1]|uniref:UDP-N-acetylglucosamine--N-acetylmuramyl- (pentapeptide) pyrophosphoryl-undecaprenol N-acetylglucosamine transferase n=1 Tax=Meiothermus sp. QL-1 TaxID=2058095 RepID=UPI000E0A314C|nr:UDP-N-acetylglucosamine--N-acetylmuramyl-(pentapeptide) pyrophosphoryl-undecaprenol N-acetylglucosamine transferase [Meiothermus sp. QL-1]RDI96540.1 UDP-N-acetylglucosamine--N-acetylmuramyl-(pentapeptide) pyrophosphoryl-undecaprenol N-acetylglucosamine transferase [Meiothermus sp. QL-1]